MRYLLCFTMIATLAALGCGGGTEDTVSEPEPASAHDTLPADADHGMPDDDVHAGAMGGAMHGSGGINAEITLAPEIADDWSAVKVRVVELETMAESFYEIPVGGKAPLDDTGLTLEVLTFIPDFVMSESGITSRSAEPQNPAARVVISEEGKDDYTGWLFAAMPEIHAFPHHTYSVVLAEGIPAT